MGISSSSADTAATISCPQDDLKHILSDQSMTKLKSISNVDDMDPGTDRRRKETYCAYLAQFIATDLCSELSDQTGENAKLPDNRRQILKNMLKSFRSDVSGMNDRGMCKILHKHLEKTLEDIKTLSTDPGDSSGRLGPGRTGSKSGKNIRRMILSALVLAMMGQNISAEALKTDRVEIAALQNDIVSYGRSFGITDVKDVPGYALSTLSGDSVLKNVYQNAGVEMVQSSTLGMSTTTKKLRSLLQRSKGTPMTVEREEASYIGGKLRETFVEIPNSKVFTLENLKELLDPKEYTHLASGMHSHVFSTGRGTIMKFTSYDESTNHEKSMLELLSTWGVGPTLHGFSADKELSVLSEANEKKLVLDSRSTGLAILEMDRADLSVSEYIDSLKKTTVKDEIMAAKKILYGKIEEVLNVLHKKGYVHGDAHLGNFVMKFRSEKVDDYDIWIVDPQFMAKPKDFNAVPLYYGRRGMKVVKDGKPDHTYVHGLLFENNDDYHK